MSWLSEDTRQLNDDVAVTYLRSRHSHEGAHDVTLYGHQLRVLPSPSTTARKRYRVIVDAIGAVDRLGHIDQLAYVVGQLVTNGAYNLLLDGEPLMPTGDAAGIWRLELAQAGQVRATYVGGSDG